MFNLYDELNEETYYFDESYGMNYNEYENSYNEYETLYNEDGTFFLESQEMIYYDEDSFELESALNEAIESVLCEHIEVFNEAVAVTEQNYIKASEEIMKKTQEQYNKLVSAMSGNKPEKAKKELVKFSNSLETKISKIQDHINNEEWDKAVRYTLGTSDLKRIATIAAIAAGAVGAGAGIGGYGNKKTLANAKRLGQARKNINAEYNKKIDYLKNSSFNEKNGKVGLRDRIANKKIAVDDEKRALKSADRGFVNSLNKYKAKKGAKIGGIVAGLTVATGAGASIIKYVTSKKVAQLPSVQAQIKKYLSFLVALNNKVKSLAR